MKKITKLNLLRTIKEEINSLQGFVLFSDLDPSVHAEDSAVTVSAEMAMSLPSGMINLLACLRAAQVWFHAAHQVTKGVGFAGDHVNIYGGIYTALVEDYDAAAEKAIGLTGDEMIACPITITALSLEKLEQYDSPAGATASVIANTGLRIMEDLNAYVEELFAGLESSGELPLGLNDFLAAAANDYTKYIYMLRQRVKER